MTNATDAKEKVTCKRCNGTGMCGPSVVYGGRCFNCEGIGWITKGEISKRNQERKDGLAAQRAALKARADFEARMAALGFTTDEAWNVSCHVTGSHESRFGAHIDPRDMSVVIDGARYRHYVHSNNPDCVVCSGELLPSEARALEPNTHVDPNYLLASVV